MFIRVLTEFYYFIYNRSDAVVRRYFMWYNFGFDWRCNRCL